MKIGVNLLAILPGKNGGVETYVRNLLCALAQGSDENQYYLFTNRFNHDSFELRDSRFIRVSMRVSGRLLASRVVWEQIALPIVAKRLKLDVLHSPSYTWPVLSGVPGVVSVYDMLYERYPEYLTKLKRGFWRTFVPWSARRCHRIITASDNSKNDIIRYLGVPEDKVVVTPGALDPRFEKTAFEPQRTREVMKRYNLEQPYILNVGGCAAHKNAAVLVRALSRVRSLPGTEQLKLVIVGRDNGARRQLEELNRALRLERAIRFTGYVSNEDLRELYCAASVYASVSHFEGFGLTVLEAMASGVPVMVSNRGSLPEVVGEAGLIVDPDCEDEVVRGLNRLATDLRLRDDLAQKTRAHLASYSWLQTARLTLKAYREALNCASTRVDSGRQAPT